MVDIQSRTAVIGEDKKKKERRTKIEIIGVKYNDLPITMCGHKKQM